MRLTAGGETQLAEIRASGSYLSQNALALRYGLADAESASLEITWPNGQTQRLANLTANQLHRIVEP